MGVFAPHVFDKAADFGQHLVASSWVLPVEYTEATILPDGGFFYVGERWWA